MLILSKKNSRMIYLGVVAMLALVSLTACGSAATSTPVPAATSTAPQVQPVPTQAPAAADTATTDTSAPDVSMTDTPMSDPTDTVASQTAATPTTAVPAADTPTASEAASDTPTTAAAAETDVQATLIEWAIKLSQSEVPVGKVRFTVTNQGSMMHNLTVEDGSGVVGRTHNFAPGDGPQTLELDLKPGTYTLICSLPGHAQRGQKTTLTVLGQSN
jgi:uncharacterized cupredoxin-like copper-binding protein